MTCLSVFAFLEPMGGVVALCSTYQSSEKRGVSEVKGGLAVFGVCVLGFSMEMWMADNLYLHLIYCICIFN